MTRSIASLLLAAALAAPGLLAAGPSGAANTLAVKDQLEISVRDVDGLAGRVLVVEPDGTVNLPLTGKIRAEGSTVEQFEKELAAQFGLYIRSPLVSVKRLIARTGSFTAAGAFRNPGTYGLPESRAVLDVIASAGGLQSNVRTIRITRRLDGGRVRLPSGVEDPATGVSTLTVSLSRLAQNPGAREDLTVERDDVLNAGLTGVVFLTGEVGRPGSFELAERESLGVMELIAMAGGLGREADPEKATVLRPILNGTRRGAIPIDVKSILAGRSVDFRVTADDLVVIPRAQGKGRSVKRSLAYIVPGLTTAAIYVAVH
jgi:polysaccharide biosynthesis/export protein